MQLPLHVLHMEGYSVGTQRGRCRRKRMGHKFSPYQTLNSTNQVSAESHNFQQPSSIALRIEWRDDKFSGRVSSTELEIAKDYSLFWCIHLSSSRLTFINSPSLNHIKVCLDRWPSSDSSFATIKRWLDDCGGSHDICQNESKFIPTRLIDVGPSDVSRHPRLVLTNALEFISATSSSLDRHYVALSYLLRKFVEFRHYFCNTRGKKRPHSSKWHVHGRCIVATNY